MKTLKVVLGVVREEPHFHSKIKYRLERGDRVSVIETKGDWYFITFGFNKNGWAHKSLFFDNEERQSSPEALIEIKDIQFELTPRGEERVTFFLGAYLPPHIFSIAGDRPRLVCDFFGAHLSKDINHRTKVNGNIVKQIRIGLQNGIRPHLRVVLDLSPHSAYNTWQEFLIDKNIYILVVGPGKNPKKTTMF